MRKCRGRKKSVSAEDAKDIETRRPQKTVKRKGRERSAKVRKRESAKARKCEGAKGTNMGEYKNLIIFQKADDLAFRIYKITERFPKHEILGLTSQIRRSALSVPTNIVEDYGRKTKKEFAQFINISLGSLAETKYLHEFSKKLGYIDSNEIEIMNLLEEVGKVLWSFYKSL